MSDVTIKCTKCGNTELCNMELRELTPTYYNTMEIKGNILYVNPEELSYEGENASEDEQMYCRKCGTVFKLEIPGLQIEFDQEFFE